MALRTPLLELSGSTHEAHQTVSNKSDTSLTVIIIYLNRAKPNTERFQTIIKTIKLVSATKIVFKIFNYLAQ